MYCFTTEVFNSIVFPVSNAYIQQYGAVLVTCFCNAVTTCNVSFLLSIYCLQEYRYRGDIGVSAAIAALGLAEIIVCIIASVVSRRKVNSGVSIVSQFHLEDELDI